MERFHVNRRIGMWADGNNEWEICGGDYVMYLMEGVKQQ